MYKKNTIKIVKICIIIVLFFSIITGITIARKSSLKNKIAQVEPSFKVEIASESSVIASQESKIDEQDRQISEYSSQNDALNNRIETLKSKVAKYSTSKTE